MIDKKLYVASNFTTKANNKTKFLNIAGYANTTSKDRSGDVVTAAAWAKGVENYRANPVLLYQHKHDCPIGKVNKIKVDKKGIYVEAGVSQAAEKNHGVQTLIRDGSLKSFSVGFRAKDGHYDKKSDSMVITDLELMEISVVSVPCNQDSLFSVRKSFKTDDEYKTFVNSFKDMHEGPMMSDKHEITVGGYNTTHFYMCGMAQTTMKDVADMPGAEELTKMQDDFFKLEKVVMDAGEANESQIVKATKMYNNIMSKAGEVGLADEIGQYMTTHLNTILKGDPEPGYGRTDIEDDMKSQDKQKDGHLKAIVTTMNEGHYHTGEMAPETHNGITTYASHMANHTHMIVDGMVQMAEGHSHDISMGGMIVLETEDNMSPNTTERPLSPSEEMVANGKSMEETVSEEEKETEQAEELTVEASPDAKIPFLNLLHSSPDKMKNGEVVDIDNKNYRIIKTATDESPTYKFLQVDSKGNSCDNTLEIKLSNLTKNSREEKKSDSLTLEIRETETKKEKAQMAEQVVDKPIDLTQAGAEKVKAEEVSTVTKQVTQETPTVKSEVSEPQVAKLVEKTGSAIMTESDAQETEKAIEVKKAAEEVETLKQEMQKYKEQIASLSNSKMKYQESQRTSPKFSEKQMANAYLLAKALNRKDPFDTKIGMTMKNVTTVDQFLSNFSSNIYTEMEQQLIIAPMFNRMAVDARNFRVPVADEDTDGDVAQFASGTFSAGISDTTRVPTSQQNTIKAVTFTPHKFMATTHLAKDEEEDTILPLLDFLRAAATRRMARAIDKSILRGRGNLTGFTAAPTNAIAVGSGYACVFKGITKLLDDAGLETDTGAAATKAAPAQIASARETMGKYGLQLGEQLVYLTTIEGYNALVTNSDFQTVDKFGPNATYLTGSVGAIYGIPIMITEFLDNAVTGESNNHIGALVYKPGYMIAERRAMEVESEYEPRQQVTALYMSTRFDFKALTTVADAALNTTNYAYGCLVRSG